MAKRKRSDAPTSEGQTPPTVAVGWSGSVAPTHWRPFHTDDLPLGKWVLVYMLGKVCPAQALMTPLGARHLGVFEDFEGKPKCVEMPIEAITHWRDLPEGPS